MLESGMIFQPFMLFKNTHTHTGSRKKGECVAIVCSQILFCDLNRSQRCCSLRHLSRSRPHWSSGDAAIVKEAI